LQGHQNGRVRSTKPKKPFEAMLYETYRSKIDAKRQERYFKTNKGKTVIKTMLKHSLY
jgi:predicted GIY-YIG superfamily endonuclease